MGLCPQRPPHRLSAEFGVGIRSRKQIPEFRCLISHTGDLVMAVNGGGSLIHVRKCRYPSSVKLNPSWQWEVGHGAHRVSTPLSTQLQLGSPSLVRMCWWQGFSLQLLHCFCSLMRGVGWTPPHPGKGWSCRALWRARVWASFIPSVRGGWAH